MKSIMKANTTTTEESSLNNSPRKVVTFSPSARMRIVSKLTSPCYHCSNTTSDTTEQQQLPIVVTRKRDLWYSQREMAKRSKKDFAIICLMNQQQSDIAVTNHNSGRPICTRGLECKTNEGFRKKIQSRIVAKQAVFDCQKRHQTTANLDMIIAQVYAKRTGQSKIDAIEMAKYDEQCVYYNCDKDGTTSATSTIDSAAPRLYNNNMLRYSKCTPSIRTRKSHCQQSSVSMVARIVASPSSSSSCPPPSKRQRVNNAVCIPKSASAPSLLQFDK